MIRFCLVESRTPLDLLDMISEIKWMEVLNQYRQRKTLRPFFLQSQFIGIVSPHGNVD